MFLDESHVMVPQIGAMYNGDKVRKGTLVEYGFRLPAAIDNRPLQFEEWQRFRPQSIYVSATPGAWELEQSGGVSAEQVIRPTGLIDPPVEVRPYDHQIDDLMSEARKVIENDGRVMVTTLTKKMAEALTEYLNDNGLKVRYMHSDIDTLERIELIRDLRLGVYDILVGINLLREGLDIPECKLMAILDADKEGFLRSRTSLIQTIGRAARNAESKVILYADTITKSMKAAMEETDRRRAKQVEHNEAHGITPTTVKKGVAEIVERQTDKAPKGKEATHHNFTLHDNEQELLHNPAALAKQIEKMRKEMHRAAENLEFETAAKIRDEIKRLEAADLGL